MTRGVATTCALALAGSTTFCLDALPRDQSSDRNQNAPARTNAPLVPGLPVRITELPGTLTLPVIESAVIESDGWVFLMGGMTSDFNATPAIQMRRPNGEWLPVGSQMREARINPDAVKLSDGRILIWGGFAGSARESLTPHLGGEIVQPKIAGDSVAITPPEGSAWTTPSPPKPLPDGTIGLIAQGSLHRFDTDSLQWRPPEPLDPPLTAATLDVLEDGTLIVCGTSPEDEALAVMQRGPKDANWSTWPASDPFRAVGAHARSLGDGRLMLLGWPRKDGRPSPETLIVDPTRKTVQAGPELPFQGGIPTWLEAISVPGGVLVLASEQRSSDELATPTALFIRAETTGRLRPWRLDTLPQRRRPNILSVGNGAIELFGGYHFSADGASMTNGTSRVKYGTGLVGD